MLQYREDKDSWVRDGRPRGVFFAPENSSTFALWKISFKKSDERYKWLENIPNGASFFKLYLRLTRFFIWYSIVIVPICFILSIISN